MKEIARQKTILRWQVLGGLVTIIFGTMLHFTFEWSGYSDLVAWFSAVNESVWEHTKMAFFPILFFGVVEYFFIAKKAGNFLYAKALEMYLAPFFIVSIFYTYVAILGDHYLWADVLDFWVSIILAKYIGYRVLVAKDKKIPKVVPVFFILVLLVLMILFTFYPLQIELFMDSVSGGYGILK